MSFGFGMRCIYFLKELYLTDFSFVLEFGIKIGKDMFTITACHCVERFMASLGQDDGIGSTDGTQGAVEGVVVDVFFD